ncbi:Urease operon accessory protein [Ciceribacter sp. L1K22]|uniref:Urease operon accessory protein n=1 Tax=Ciceribacter sp. L1K22 TaxID=2820275 RepID=UPI001ABD9E3C|nr:Urease operon accessory protein [Ciceribacter sp. L1K22]MBO3761257.1 Urease operon accessory protein [Ciceribacter sp. L1K22]
MIVGNGPVADGSDRMIDLSDLVIRFNDSRNLGPAGRRTDVVAVCNTGRPAHAMVTSQQWRGSPAVVGSREIWSVRDPEKFTALRPQLAITNPELDDFCDDRTADFATFAQESGKAHRVIPATVHEAADVALAAHEPGPYVVPSSGMVVVTHILGDFGFAGDEIVIAGFGHTGWDGHPFAAERRLIETYIAAGRLQRLPSSSSPSQGA